jgi:hypothetical protein
MRTSLLSTRIYQGYFGKTKLIMKTYIILILSCTLLSCTFKDSKIVRKSIDYKDINVKWYYYSYISNNSPDIVEVTKDSTVEIYRASLMISDVLVKDNNITIKGFGPTHGIRETEEVLSEAFGYKIVIDTTATEEEFWAKPLGKKE